MPSAHDRGRRSFFRLAAAAALVGAGGCAGNLAPSPECAPAAAPPPPAPARHVPASLRFARLRSVRLAADVQPAVAFRPLGTRNGR